MVLIVVNITVMGTVVLINMVGNTRVWISWMEHSMVEPWNVMGIVTIVTGMGKLGLIVMDCSMAMLKQWLLPHAMVVAWMVHNVSFLMDNSSMVIVQWDMMVKWKVLDLQVAL